MHYHLIGIAGTAMGSLAGLLQAKGHRVTGSDAGVYPPMSTLLEQFGIEVRTPFDPANLSPAPDVVVVGNAISRGNPELEAVLERGLRYSSAADVIREEFLEGRHVLAVAGTHGKTTTSALLTWILERAGLAPSFLVGGVLENLGTSQRLADSPFFVIEADEYDTAFWDKGPKMWHYRPRTAVIGNVEFDHADIFRDERAYRFAFERFANLVPRNGTLVAGWDSPPVREIAAKCPGPVASFGLGEPGAGGAGGPHPLWRAVDISYGPEGTRFTVVKGGEPIGPVETSLAGAFNVRNALAALVAADAAGASWEGIVDGLRSFRSVRRRMELRGEPRGVAIVDDFAHHPTAVAETIEAARHRFPGRRIVAVFEPRSYTAQRREFQEAYRSALGGADRVVLAGLFHPERYDRDTGMDPEELVRAIRGDGTPAEHIPEVDRIVEALADAAPGDVILVMSNGGFGGIHEKLLARLGAPR